MHLSRLRSLLSLLAGASLLGSAALASTSGAGSAAGPVVVDAAPRPVNHFASTCMGYCKHPTNAGKVFRWGLEAWEDEAEKADLDNTWRSNHPKLVGNQHGMLTIEAKPHTALVTAHPTNMKAAYGRWEARVRAVELETKNKTFRFAWELAPVGGKKTYHCGAQSIVMASYRPGQSKAVRGAVRALDDTQFTFSRTMDLRSRAWHTYAVEVTKSHVSWFVDTKVIHTETRDAATTGVTFKPRFRIVGDKDATMNHSWMQMDWVRYYDLHRDNARSIKAPAMEKSTFKGAC